MKCTKMEGCGNDFVFVDYQEAENMNLSKLSVKLCDRHFGIGADGAIFVKQNPLEFIYYNSDGSYSPFCGNGMRCFVLYCIKNKIVSEHEFDVVCKQWSVHCRIQEDEIIVQIPEIKSEIQDNGTEIIEVCGSRHKVIEVKSLDEIENIQSDAYNLNYVEWINKNEIRIKTIERGAGITLSCGSGSVASAWKMYKNKKCFEKIFVKNPGGTLKIDIKNREMSGPARFVFECNLNESAPKREESA